MYNATYIYLCIYCKQCIYVISRQSQPYLANEEMFRTSSTKPFSFGLVVSWNSPLSPHRGYLCSSSCFRYKVYTFIHACILWLYILIYFQFYRMSVHTVQAGAGSRWAMSPNYPDSGELSRKTRSEDLRSPKASVII